jgi:hypothetical protein
MNEAECREILKDYIDRGRKAWGNHGLFGPKSADGGYHRIDNINGKCWIGWNPKFDGKTPNIQGWPSKQLVDAAFFYVGLFQGLTTFMPHDNTSHGAKSRE